MSTFDSHISVEIRFHKNGPRYKQALVYEIDNNKPSKWTEGNFVYFNEKCVDRFNVDNDAHYLQYRLSDKFIELQKKYPTSIIKIFDGDMGHILQPSILR